MVLCGVNAQRQKQKIKKEQWKILKFRIIFSEILKSWLSFLQTWLLI